jgi:hypothetical protein
MPTGHPINARFQAKTQTISKAWKVFNTKSQPIIKIVKNAIKSLELLHLLGDFRHNFSQKSS